MAIVVLCRDAILDQPKKNAVDIEDWKKMGKWVKKRVYQGAHQIREIFEMGKKWDN